MCVAKRPLYLASDVARDFACSKHIGLHPLIAASPMSTVLTVLTSSDNSNELSELAEHLTKASGSKKRRKLKTYDLVPAQLLNSMGVSGVETITLEKLATAMSKGNKMAIYFTEFCDGEYQLARCSRARGLHRPQESKVTHTGHSCFTDRSVAHQQSTLLRSQI